MMQPEVDAVLRYAHLEDLSDDASTVAQIEFYRDAAVEYLAGCRVIRSEKNARRYDLAVCGLATHWYDNRDVLTAGTAMETPMGIRQVINQLKWTG